MLALRLFVLGVFLLALPAPSHAGVWLGGYTDDNGDVAGHVEALADVHGVAVYGFADAGQNTAFARINATLPIEDGFGGFAQADFSSDPVAFGGLAYGRTFGPVWASVRLMGGTNGTGRAMLVWDAPLPYGLNFHGFINYDTDGRLHLEPELSLHVWGPLHALVEYRHHTNSDSVALGVRCDLY